MNYPKIIYADTDLVAGEEQKEGYQKYVRADDRLIAAIQGVMQIVEGMRRQRWSDGKTRLVDTKEWCEFYVAWYAEKQLKCSKCNKRDGDNEPYIGIWLCPECREEILTKNKEACDMTPNKVFAASAPPTAELREALDDVLDALSWCAHSDSWPDYHYNKLENARRVLAKSKSTFRAEHGGEK